MSGCFKGDIDALPDRLIGHQICGSGADAKIVNHIHRHDRFVFGDILVDLRIGHASEAALPAHQQKFNVIGLFGCRLFERRFEDFETVFFADHFSL